MECAISEDQETDPLEYRHKGAVGDEIAYPVMRHEHPRAENQEQNRGWQHKSVVKPRHRLGQIATVHRLQPGDRQEAQGGNQHDPHGEKPSHKGGEVIELRSRKMPVVFSVKLLWASCFNSISRICHIALLLWTSPGSCHYGESHSASPIAPTRTMTR
jgi:hypothetical protein